MGPISELEIKLGAFMSIQLEVGKKYVMRNNPFVKYVEINVGYLGSSFYGTLVSLDEQFIPAGLCWNPDGTNSGNDDSDLDLVAEYNPFLIKLPTGLKVRPAYCRGHTAIDTGFSFSYCQHCDGKLYMDHNVGAWVLDKEQGLEYSRAV